MLKVGPDTHRQQRQRDHHGYPEDRGAGIEIIPQNRNSQRVRKRLPQEPDELGKGVGLKFESRRLPKDRRT